jgi:hypothetical protein
MVAVVVEGVVPEVELTTTVPSSMGVSLWRLLVPVEVIIVLVDWNSGACLLELIIYLYRRNAVEADLGKECEERIITKAKQNPISMKGSTDNLPYTPYVHHKSTKYSEGVICSSLFTKNGVYMHMYHTLGGV